MNNQTKKTTKEKWKKFVFGEKKEKIKKEKQPLDKQDLLCYGGSLFFLLLAFFPLILRALDPNYDPVKYYEEKEIASSKDIKKMSCSRLFNGKGFKYRVEITSIYQGGKVQTSEFKYTITSNVSNNATLDLGIDEFINISSIKSDAIAVREDSKISIVKVDYRKDKKVRNNGFLQAHNKTLSFQREKYQNDNYQCVVSEGKL